MPTSSFLPAMACQPLVLNEAAVLSRTTFFNIRRRGKELQNRQPGTRAPRNAVRRGLIKAWRRLNGTTAAQYSKYEYAGDSQRSVTIEPRASATALWRR